MVYDQVTRDQRQLRKEVTDIKAKIDCNQKKKGSGKKSSEMKTAENVIKSATIF